MLPPSGATFRAAGATAAAFVPEPGAGTRVVSPIAIPGLMSGDIVTRAGETAAPTPAQLQQVLATPLRGGFTILIVRRDGHERVVAARVPEASDAAIR